MTAICDGYIISDKTEDGRRSAHYELKWEIPLYAQDVLSHKMQVKLCGWCEEKSVGKLPEDRRGITVLLSRKKKGSRISLKLTTRRLMGFQS